MGMPPTGKRVEMTDLNMARVADDGRPIEHWIGTDRMEIDGAARAGAAAGRASA